jgi:hypothetical protein
MPISLPNLDDRTYADLVEEGRALIPSYAPQWTNHNASDPGVTLIEMFAYLTEMLIYRLNRITDDNTIAFLDLIYGPAESWNEQGMSWAGQGGRREKIKAIQDPNEKKRALEKEAADAVLSLRNPDRAVTRADFEALSLKAPPANGERVARARSVPGRNLEAGGANAQGASQPAHISIIIVPDTGQAAPQPSTELIASVGSYLEERRLLGTVIHVVGPRYTTVGVQVTLYLDSDAKEQEVSERATQELLRFFDPLRGGQDGGGWPFGRNVYVSEIYNLLDRLPGVDFVVKSGDSLDELTASDSSRLKRNSSGELVAVEIYPDELVATSEQDIKLVLVREQSVK